jgi:hypothetical protein
VTPAACREGGITEQTNYRWRKQSGGLQVDQARRLKGLVPLSTGAHKPMHVSSTNRPGPSGSGRIVAKPDITPFWDNFRLAGDAPAISGETCHKRLLFWELAKDVDSRAQEISFGSSITHSLSSPYHRKKGSQYLSRSSQ